MKRVLTGLLGGLVVIGGLGLAVPDAAGQGRRHRPVEVPVCPSDSVRSGTVCIDKYEASVWLVAPWETDLIEKIQAGTATLGELRARGIQRGLEDRDLDLDCPVDAAGCTNIYAVSIKKVIPAKWINWFQAAAAARNSHKRLPTNQEWQAAALGTPEGAPCNVEPPMTPPTNRNTIAKTGSAPGCVSDAGAFDMVANVWEWVADWVPRSADICGSWNNLAFSGLGLSSEQCLNGVTSDGGAPAALMRGGSFIGDGAGVFAVSGQRPPSSFGADNVGFRAAR